CQFEELCNLIHNNLSSNNRFLALPEIFGVDERQSMLIPITEPNLVKIVYETFSDVVLSNAGIELFDIITSGFSDPSWISRNSTKAVSKKAIANAFQQGLPPIIISDRNDGDMNAGVNLIAAEGYPISVNGTSPVDSEEALPLLPRSGVIGQGVESARIPYGAHIRGTANETGKELGAFHISASLIQLLAASINQYATSRPSYLATVAGLKTALVREISHFMVKTIHEADQNVLELSRDRPWITHEMLDSDGNPDSGHIVEVLWLGHRVELVYGPGKRYHHQS
ncbi:hypothetical protein MPER_07600, partial [Moniliophthora perniciosa FA553]